MSSTGLGLQVPERLCADLQALPDLIESAWFAADENPASSDELRTLLVAHARRLCMLERHLRDAIDRATRRDSAERKALQQGNRALARLVVVGPNHLNPHGFYVYLLWGDDDEKPIYVGQSANIYNRLGTHMGEAAKRRRVKRITVLRCPGKRQMDKTELELIRHYRPELNQQGLKGRAA